MLHSHSMNNILNINCLSLSLIAEVRMNVLSNLITVVKMFVFSWWQRPRYRRYTLRLTSNIPLYSAGGPLHVPRAAGGATEPDQRLEAGPRHAHLLQRLRDQLRGVRPPSQPGHCSHRAAAAA